MFVRLPAVVCIHLKRLAGMGYKNETEVLFEEELDMAPFCAPTSGTWFAAGGTGGGGWAGTQRWGECRVPPAPIYELCAVIVHIGGAGGGHYVTYRRQFAADTPTTSSSSTGPTTVATTLASSTSPHAQQAAGGAWVLASDDSVVRVGLNEVLLSRPYMLFYQRVQR